MRCGVTREASGWSTTPPPKTANIADVLGIAPADADPMTVETYEAALAAPTRLVLLLPRDEVAAVLEMDGGRDRILSPARAQPVLLFLLRGGDGDRTLHTDATSLRSFVQGSEADPDLADTADPQAERAAFAEENAASPEIWLSRWADGEIAPSAAAYRTAVRARWLVG